MKKSVIRFSVLALVILMLGTLTTFVSAQGDVPREDTVIFDIDDSAVPNPTNFNWLVPGVNRNQGAHQAMWEPLFILNYETGEIQPWLGLSFTPNDTLDVWTLKLRPGVEWSDGVPFTADDVVFTMELLLGDKTATLTEAANQQQWVKDVQKIDDLTVQFNLKAANPRYQLDYWSVRIWGNGYILPKHVWEGKDPFTFTFYDPEKGWPLGTGPYTLTSAAPTQFVWDRNDNWWGAKTNWHALPEPKRLIWIIAPSEDQKALLLSTHQLDSVMNLTLGAFQAVLQRNPKAIAWRAEAPYTWADPCPREIVFNTEFAPWDNANLRKAVSLLINRNKDIEIAYEGTTIPSRTIFVEYGGMAKYIDAIVAAGMGVKPEGDVAAGQALIEAAGYTKNADGLYEKDGKVLSLNLIVHNSTIEYVRSNNEIVEQLRAGGIDATSQPLQDATADDARANGQFEASWAWDSCGSVNEPWNSLNHLSADFYVPIGQRASGNLNNQRWNTEGAKAYSKIVKEIGSLPLGDPKIVDMVVEAYKYIDAETPTIPLVQAPKLVPFDTTYWTNWPTQENNYNHPATWWNSTEQIILNLHKAGS